MERYDVAVLGLGAMGSAAIAHCALRGARTIGFEQFELEHDRGSSAGRSRIIRRAYFEDVAYVPLLERAYALWHDLEVRTGRRLLDLCGVLVIDRNDGATARGVLRAAREHDIGVTTFSRRELASRFPQFTMLDDEIAILEPDAGIVFPEAAIGAHVDLAREHGAVLCSRARVRGWERRNDALSIALDDGREIIASRLVVTAGAWLPVLLARAGLPLEVQRNVQYWFEPRAARFGRDDLPAFFIERDTLPAPLYGMPDLGEGVKVALHGYGKTTTADDLERDVGEDEADGIRELLRSCIPEAAGILRSSKACMYTMTPDAHFAIGHDPLDERVVVAGGFSGHGFKFAPAIGEVLAQLALDGGTQHEIGFLDLTRFVPK